MTVGQVYRDLRDSGLIETRPGLGTFVAETRGPRMRSPAQMADLQHRLDHLIDHALAIGLRPADIAAMMQARLGRRNARVRTRLVLVAGLFPEATRAYARAIGDRLGDGLRVGAVTLDDLTRSETARPRPAEAEYRKSVGEGKRV